jgi:hypothetical protein
MISVQTREEIMKTDIINKLQWMGSVDLASMYSN